MPDLFGGISESEQYKYKPTAYQSYGAYKPYGSYSTLQSQMPQIGNVANELLAGGLSDAEQKYLDKQMSKNLGSVREGAYGMPIGAQKGLEYGTAADVALQGLLYGQQKRQQALPYLNLMAGENQYGYGQGKQDYQYGYGAGQQENQFGQGYSQRENQFGANVDMQNTNARLESGFDLGDVLQPVIGAATTYGLGAINPLGATRGLSQGLPGQQNNDNDLVQNYKSNFGYKR